MRHQLEFDLMNMSNEKRSRKNALRRRSGHYTGSWNAGVNPGSAPPAQGQQQSQQKQQREKRSAAVDGGGGGKFFTGVEGMEGVDVVRNHSWVMERVKMKKREESRLKREKYGSKRITIWSPSMEQVRCGWGISRCEEGAVLRLVLGCAGVPHGSRTPIGCLSLDVCVYI